MAKITDKFFNRIIEGDVEFQENEQAQVQSLMEQGEPMEGYSATLSSSVGATIENVYQGIVKNGNKLTLVCAVKITRTANFSGDLEIARFTIPDDIKSKLIPYVISNLDTLSLGNTTAMNSYKTGVNIPTLIEKTLSGNLAVWLVDASKINQLEADTEYYVRIEATFLLSDNLIPNA